MSAIKLIIAEDHPVYRDGLRQMISRNVNLHIVPKLAMVPALSALRPSNDPTGCFLMSICPK